MAAKGTIFNTLSTWITSVYKHAPVLCSSWGNLYVFIPTSDGSTYTRIEVYRSTDGGTNWALLNANYWTPTNIGSLSDAIEGMHVSQNGDEFRILITYFGSPDTYITEYNTFTPNSSGTGTWGTQQTVYNSTAGEDLTPTYATCDLVERSDGDLVAFHHYTPEKIKGTIYGRLAATVDSGSGFGTPVVKDAGVANSYKGGSGAWVTTADSMTVVYKINTTGAGGLVSSSFNASDTWGTGQSTIDSSAYIAHPAGSYMDDSGTDRELLPYMDGTAYLSAWENTEGSGYTQRSISALSGGTFRTGCATADLLGDDAPQWFAAHLGTSAGVYYYTAAGGGTFDSGTQVDSTTGLDEGPCVSVFTHNATNGGDTVAGIVYGVWAGTDLYYAEVVLASGVTPVAVSGTGTASSKGDGIALSVSRAISSTTGRAAAAATAAASVEYALDSTGTAAAQASAVLGVERQVSGTGTAASQATASITKLIVLSSATGEEFHDPDAGAYIRQIGYQPSGVGTVTVGLPFGTEVGHLVVLFTLTRGSSWTVKPTGWSSIVDTIALPATSSYAYAWAKIMEPSDLANGKSVDVQVDGACDVIATSLAFPNHTNVVPDSDEGTWRTAYAAANTAYSPSLVLSGDHKRTWLTVIIAQDDLDSTSPTAPTSYSLKGYNEYLGSGSGSISLAWRNLETNAETPGTWTHDQGSVICGVTLSLEAIPTGQATAHSRATLGLLYALSGAGTAASQASADLTVTAGAIVLEGTGTAAAQATADADVLYALTATGTAAAQASATAVRTRLITSDGQAASQAAATLGVQRPLASSTNAAAQTTATLDVLTYLDGTGTAASQATATLLNTRYITSQGDAAAQPTALLGIQRPLASAISAAAQADADLTNTRYITSSAPAAAQATATLTVEEGLLEISGTGAASAQATATLGVALPLTSSTNAAAAATATSTLTRFVTSQGNASSAATADLDALYALTSQGNASAQASAVLSLAGQVPIFGTGTAAARPTATLTSLYALNADGQAAAQTTAQPTLQRNLTSTAPAASQATAALTLDRYLTASAPASAASTANLTRIYTLSSSASAAAQTSADLTLLYALATSAPASAQASATLTLGSEIPLVGSGGAAAQAGSVEMLVERKVVGSGPAAAVADASVGVERALASTGEAAAQGSATVVRGRLVSSQGEAASQATATLTGLWSLYGQGNASARATAVVSLAGQIPIFAVGAASAQATASLSAEWALTADGRASAASTATPSLERHLAAAGTASSATSASITVQRPIAGTGTASAATTADITNTRLMSGSGTSAAQAAATVLLARFLVGDGRNAADASAAVGIARALLASGAASSETSAALAAQWALASAASASALADDIPLILIGGIVPMLASGNAAAIALATLLITPPVTRILGRRHPGDPARNVGSPSRTVGSPSRSSDPINIYHDGDGDGDTDSDRYNEFSEA